MPQPRPDPIDVSLPELVRAVGIGLRVRAAFAPAGSDIAIPLWTLDTMEAADAMPLRYPE